MKHRICVVVQSYYLRDPRVRREAEALAKEGHHVDVICLHDRGEKWQETINKVNITRLPIARRRATALRYLQEYTVFFALTAMLLVLRIFRRYHLIHVNNMPDFLVFATILPKLFGSRILLDVHDPMAEVYMSKYNIGQRNPIISLLRWQEKISLRYCHHILTVSDVMKERLQRIAAYTPVSVVLNVPDESLFHRPEEDKSQRESEHFTLLYTGTISRRYGLDVAIDAVALLRDKIPNLRLRIVGEGDDLPYLRDMVSRLGIEDAVEFHPALPLSQIPEIIEDSDIGISPHVRDCFMDLYFSTKVAEFVNMGLPTIVSRTQTIERYFNDSMVKYCEPESTDSFANAVWDVYSDPDLRARLSWCCREFSDRWSWSVEKQNYLKVVAKLLNIKTVDMPVPKAKVLILVENLSVPFDRRVWMESLALTDAGYKVSVICPDSPGELRFESLNDVSIFRYPAPKDARGLFSYLWEFTYSMLMAFRLSRLVKKREGFDLIQGCNPPDTFFAIGWFYKVFYGKKFIFDHHDLSPELYAVRFNKAANSGLSRILLWLERCTFRVADVVISTNESFRNIAIKRGRMNPDSVVVVRNGPDLARFKPAKPNPDFLMGREHLVCYIGVMASQDGLDYLLKAIHHIVYSCGRHDMTFTLIGSGDMVDKLKCMTKQLNIEDYVVFTGRITDDELLCAYLSTASVCVAPDPCNALNDNCTLIKIPEYMAMSKPIVSFDLTESRFSAQEAAVYATSNDFAEFGERIIELIDDPARRKIMGERGLARVKECLSWDHSKRHLVSAYEIALNNDSAKNASGSSERSKSI